MLGAARRASIKDFSPEMLATAAAADENGADAGWIVLAERATKRIEIRRLTSSNGPVAKTAAAAAAELRWWSLVSHLLTSTAGFQIRTMTPRQASKTVVVCDVVSAMSVHVL